MFDSFAKEQANVSSAVSELPSTLKQTTDTLGRVETFAELLGPTTEKLRPAARALAPANEAVRPFAREATPQLRKSIRPFVRESRPLVRDLRPVSTRLAKAGPDLTQVVFRFNRFLNLLGYNQNGKEGPDNAARQEGYLFWLAWLNHSATQLFSSSDAHGTLRPVTIAAPCATLTQVLQAQPELEFTSVLTPLLTDSKACNGGTDGGNQPELPELPDLPIGKRRRADADLHALLLARPRHGRLRALVLRAAAVPVAVVRRADPAQAEGLPRPGRLPRGDPARPRGRRPRGRRVGRQAAQEDARPATPTARSPCSRSTASSRR